MSWASKRQFSYLSIVLIVVLAVLFAIIYPKVNVAPTCTDNKQNASETGVDCGGICSRICRGDAKDITVLWARSFEVIPGVYHAVAYFENKNIDMGVRSVPYEFKIYDADNKLITSRTGETFVSPNGRMAIFEESLETGLNRVPKFTRFQFTKEPVFYRVPEEYRSVKVVEADKNLTDLEASPKASATLSNPTFVDVGAFEVMAIVYDAFDNAIASSKTFVDELPRQSEAKVFFSWPTPFPEEARRLEILPLINAYEFGGQ